MILLNGFPDLRHERKAERSQCLSMQPVVRVGASNLADADRASLADLAVRRWPLGQ
ncbi:hypothetical protein D3C86_2033860 [compost metagenome]